VDDARTLPSAARRAVASLGEGSGRTLVIAGPGVSGKSALLERIARQLNLRQFRVVELAGTFRARDAAYGLVRPLVEPAASTGGAPESRESAPGFASPLATGGFPGDEAPPSRRARGERQHGRVLGVSYAVRGRGRAELDPAEFWSTIRDEVSPPPKGARAILVDDATFADAGSRDFLLFLVEHARFRPLLLVLVLDTENPAFQDWEQRLSPRGDVDWIRIPTRIEDPREAGRFRPAFEHLPLATRRVLGFAALLGGVTTEVRLSRVTRLTFGQLAETLLPAVDAHLVKLDAGKVAISPLSWAPLVPSALTEAQVRPMHREIAEALEAMSPEPTLTDRLEIGRHYLAWEAGPTALRYLLESAALSERDGQYDAVVDLLDQALDCLPGMPSDSRAAAEVELRLVRARALFLAGRPGEAEKDLHEGIVLGLDRGVPADSFEEWLEPMLAPLVVVGPRPSLILELGELADRFAYRGLVAPAVLFLALIAEFELERGRADKARQDSHRAGHLARRLAPGPLQALALFVVGLTRIEGESDERTVAERFLEAAHRMLGGTGQGVLQQLVEEFRIRLVAREGARDQALEAHLRAVPILQQLRLRSLELPHQLGIAESLLGTKPDERATRALRRAHELIESLHVLPPAPALFRLWYLEGWNLSRVPEPIGARERLSAVTDRPRGLVPPAILHEARLRRAILELADGKDAVARRYFLATDPRRFRGGHRPTWEAWRAANGPARATSEESAGSDPT
jgi:tetratricopeptide (TPR) repeat protein